MIKLYFKLLLTIFLTQTVIAQETVLTLNNSLKTSSSKIKGVIPVVNSKNNNMAFFVTDAKQTYSYRIDSTFKVTDRIVSTPKKRKYRILLGSSISKENSYRIFFSNNQDNEFYSIETSFDNKKISSNEFSLPPKETFIQTISHDNQFYLISIHKLNKQLFIYTFDEQGNPKRNNINTRKHDFLNSKGKKTAFIDLLKDKDNPLKISTGRSITKIEENTPNSIQLTSNIKKLYIREGTILFTFDNYNKLTQALEINLTTFETKYHQFKKPRFKEKIQKSNSYVNGDHFFTLTVSDEKFVLEILDFKSKSLLKRYFTLKDKDITFKNTPIIQEGSIYDDYRELKKTKQFLRKITKDKAGISVRKIHNQYHFIIGGYSIMTYNGGGVMMSGGGGVSGFPMSNNLPIASFGNFNITLSAYNSFSSQKTTWFESLLDENFNHVKGEVKENVFDKMDEFKSIKSIKTGSTVFKHKGYYIKTIYLPNSKNFYFKKFSD